MSNTCRMGVFLACIFGVAAAQAQPARTDSVTVTGIRDQDAAISSFVKSHATPSRLISKITRWQDRICPQTVGLGPKYAAFVSARIRAVAAQVGAPVNPDNGCKANIDIVFTTTPQALLDRVRQAAPVLLGYYDSNAQADALARVTHPIQAWYLTQTRDLHGLAQVDGRMSNGEIEIPYGPGLTMRFPFANAATVTGNHLGDGLTSDFFHVLIVAEPARLKDHEIGTLADYIAMIALAQFQALESCQSLASIVSLLAPGCGSDVAAMSESDRGYLKGLYSMSAGATIGVQRNAIGFGMRKAMTGKDRN